MNAALLSVLVVITLLVVLVDAGNPAKVKCSPKCRCTKEYAYCIYADITAKELKDILPTIPSSTKKLYLNGNKIIKVDIEDFKHLTNLIYLSINFNQISSLPKDVRRFLPNLNTLHLTANNIKTISSDELKGYENLNILNLDQNLIHSIGDNTFAKMSKLKVLLLGQNKLRSISQNTFKGLCNLVKLQLSDNSIEVIHESAFQWSIQLEELYLYVNKITRVQKGLFAGLTRLRIIYLSDNFIKEIEKRSFDGLSLKTVYLNLNLLKSLPNDMFKGTRLFGNIFLLDNQFECDCRFANAVSEAIANIKAKGAKGKRLHFGDCKIPEVIPVTSATVSNLNCTACDINVCSESTNCKLDKTSSKEFRCIDNEKVGEFNSHSNKRSPVRQDRKSNEVPHYIYWLVAAMSFVVVICGMVVVVLFLQSRQKQKQFDMDVKFIYEKVNTTNDIIPKLTSLTTKNSFNVGPSILPVR